MKVFLQFVLLLTAASSAIAQTGNGYARVCAADMYPDKSANKSGPINVYWSVWEPVTEAHFEYVSPDAFWNYLKAQYPAISQNFHPASNLRCFGFRPDNRDPRPEFRISSIREAIAMMEADLSRRGFSGPVSHVMTKFRFYNDSPESAMPARPAAQTATGTANSPTTTSGVSNPSAVTTEEVVDLVSTGIQVLGSMWEERAAKKRAEEERRAQGEAGYAQAVAETRRLVEQKQARYREAALSGDAEAQYQMAAAHFNTTIDFEYHGPESRRWLRLAAKQGHPRALTTLAGMTGGDLLEREKLLKAALENPVADPFWETETYLGLAWLYDPTAPIRKLSDAELKSAGITARTPTDLREASRYYRLAEASLTALTPESHMMASSLIDRAKEDIARVKRHPFFCDRTKMKDYDLRFDVGTSIENRFRCLFEKSGDVTRDVTMDGYWFRLRDSTKITITATPIRDVQSISLSVYHDRGNKLIQSARATGEPATINVELGPGAYALYATTPHEPFTDPRYKIEVLGNGQSALTMKDIGAKLDEAGFFGVLRNQKLADADRKHRKKFSYKETSSVALETKFRFKPAPQDRWVQMMCVRQNEDSTLPHAIPRPYLYNIKANEKEATFLPSVFWIGTTGNVRTKCWSGAEEILDATYRVDSGY